MTEAGLPWSHSNHKLPCAPTTRYPDYLFVATEHVVLLEVDENEHRNYNAKCEVSRLSELLDSVGHRNMHVIRFNPNEVGSTTEDKKVRVLSAIRTALATNHGCLNDTGCVVQYIGYSVDRIVELDHLSCVLQHQE